MVNSVSKILAAFILLIVGISLIVVVANSSNSVTDIGRTTQTIDISAAKLDPFRNLTVTNETGWINRTGYQLNVTLLTGGDVLNLQQIYIINARNGSTIINSGNYTVNASGFVKNLTSIEYNTVVFNWTYTYTSTSSGINTSYQFQVNNGVGTWRADYSDCLASSIDYRNQSSNLLTASTDYIYTSSTGILTLLNTASLNRTAAGNTTTADYSYCQDGYMTLGWGRTSIDTAIGLFGVALLLAGVGFMISVFKDFGFF